MPLAYKERVTSRAQLRPPRSGAGSDHGTGSFKILCGSKVHSQAIAVALGVEARAELPGHPRASFPNLFRLCSVRAGKMTEDNHQ
jgi:hypothetical protein